MTREEFPAGTKLLIGDGTHRPFTQKIVEWSPSGEWVNVWSGDVWGENGWVSAAKFNPNIIEVLSAPASDLTTFTTVEV